MSLSRFLAFPVCSESILVVDTTHAFRELVRESFTAAGHRVTVVADASTGLSRFCAAPKEFDVALFSIERSDAHALRAARILRATRRDLPVIAITGEASPEQRTELILLGCRCVATKPLALEQLGNHLRDAARRRLAA